MQEEIYINYHLMCFNELKIIGLKNKNIFYSDTLVCEKKNLFKRSLSI